MPGSAGTSRKPPSSCAATWNHRIPWPWSPIQVGRGGGASAMAFPNGRCPLPGASLPADRAACLRHENLGPGAARRRQRDMRASPSCWAPFLQAGA
jgi:hypothetical protein